MEIKRRGAQPSAISPVETFTGAGHIDPGFNLRPPTRGFGVQVTFEPGARGAFITVQ